MKGEGEGEGEGRGYGVLARSGEVRFVEGVVLWHVLHRVLAEASGDRQEFFVLARFTVETVRIWRARKDCRGRLSLECVAPNDWPLGTV